VGERIEQTSNELAPQGFQPWGVSMNATPPITIPQGVLEEVMQKLNEVKALLEEALLKLKAIEEALQALGGDHE